MEGITDWLIRQMNGENTSTITNKIPSELIEQNQKKQPTPESPPSTPTPKLFIENQKVSATPSAPI